MSDDAGPLNVLVADDTPEILKYVRLFLERRGFMVIQAKDGHEALAKATEQEPDIVMLDSMMPDLDGLTACRRLRAAYGDTLAIVFHSAAVTAESRLEAFDAGADDVILKSSVTGNSLAERLRSVHKANIVSNLDGSTVLLSVPAHCAGVFVNHMIGGM